MTLRFTVPGKVASNNRVTRNYHGRATKNPDAVLYQSRVAEHALMAVKQSGWRWPPACTVSITHWNGMLDADNACKAAIDSMKGIVYLDDRPQYVRGVSVWTDADGGEEYIEIVVQECAPRPEIVRRKCSVCLEIRTGAKIKPHLCGWCAGRRRRAA